MRLQRVTEANLRATARNNKFGSLSEVEAIVLESSGDFSVIGQLKDASALGPELRSQIDDQPADLS